MVAELFKGYFILGVDHIFSGVIVAVFALATDQTYLNSITFLSHVRQYNKKGLDFQSSLR
jgi:hypothetical protein